MTTAHHPEPPKQKPLRWILTSIALLLLLGALIYQYASQRRILQQRSADLDQELQDKVRAWEKEKARADQLDSQLQEYRAYDAIIQSSRIREALYRQLPLAAGDKVLILPDSMPGVVQAVTVSGNAMEYSIRYRVRGKDGQLADLSYTDLLKQGE
jgi:molybdopterin converting factor small subunit